jgi:hypothetical protein
VYDLLRDGQDALYCALKGTINASAQQRIDDHIGLFKGAFEFRGILIGVKEQAVDVVSLEPLHIWVIAGPCFPQIAEDLCTHLGQVPGRNQPIPSVIAWPDQDKDMCVLDIHSALHCLGNQASSILHHRVIGMSKIIRGPFQIFHLLDSNQLHHILRDGPSGASAQVYCKESSGASP